MVEHEHQLVFGVNDVVERNYVLVLELLHERNLADGGTGRALFGVEVDLLQGDELAGLSVSAFEHLKCTIKSVDTSGVQSNHDELTVAYVPSPSFSSCWKAEGLFLLILATSMLCASLRMASNQIGWIFNCGSVRDIFWLVVEERLSKSDELLRKER